LLRYRKVIVFPFARFEVGLCGGACQYQTAARRSSCSRLADHVEVHESVCGPIASFRCCGVFRSLFGAKRKFKEPRLHNRIYEHTAQCPARNSKKPVMTKPFRNISRRGSACGRQNLTPRTARALIFGQRSRVQKTAPLNPVSLLNNLGAPDKLNAQAGNGWHTRRSRVGVLSKLPRAKRSRRAFA
jgi:hypothetical protein